jgi:hypothetical protein
MIEVFAPPEAGIGTRARFVICWHEHADPPSRFRDLRHSVSTANRARPATPGARLPSEGRNGVRGLPVCRHAFSLSIPEVSAVSQNGAQCLSSLTDDGPFVNVLQQLSSQLDA